MARAGLGWIGVIAAAFVLAGCGQAASVEARKNLAAGAGVESAAKR